MSAPDVLGTVCDRLVGGMMFHSDHADLCRLMGVGWLAELHEDGYLHDSKAHAKVRREAIRHTCLIAPSGRQERTHTLDQWQGRKAHEVTREQRQSALEDAMADWCDWEESAAATYRTAYRRMLECGCMELAELMRKLATDTECELAHARELRVEMMACDWDMSHVLEMG